MSHLAALLLAALASSAAAAPPHSATNPGSPLVLAGACSFAPRHPAACAVSAF